MRVRALAADFDRLAALDDAERLDDSRDERPQVFHAIPYMHDDDRGNADLWEILLIREIGISSEQHVETGGNSGAEENTVAKAQPFLRVNGSDVEIRQLVRELNG